MHRIVLALLLLVVCLGCAAQSNAPDLNLRIERAIRLKFDIPPNVDIKVGERKPSDISNFDTLQVAFSGPQVPHGTETHEFLISKDNKTLARMTRYDISKDPYQAIMDKIDTTGRPVRGNKDAKVTIVNFDDFECPFCARMHATLMQDVLKTYGDKIKIVYVDYPLYEIHPWAIHAAVDANCLAAQNPDAYWDFADFVHGNQKDISNAGGDKKDLKQSEAMLDHLTELQGQKHGVDSGKLQACVKAQSDAAVMASHKAGEDLGLNATPTMFINGQKIEGVVPMDQFRAVLDRALRDAGQTPPAAPAAPTPGNDK